MNNRKLLILLLIFTSVILTATEKNENSLWKFASPAADVILYFNTKQPEQAMDKNLWQLIQKDKQRAIDSSGDEQLFDMKNRDMEAIANLYIHSISPFSATIEGIANITGNIHNDIQKLLAALKQDSGPVPQIKEIDKVPRYNFSMPGAENMPPVDIMFTPVNNNQLHFRINIVPRGAMSQIAIGTSQGNVQILKTVPQQEQAFVIAGNIENFAALSAMYGERTQHISSYLTQIQTLCIYGNIQSQHLIINTDVILKDPASVGKFVQMLANVSEKLSRIAQFDDSPRIVSKGKIVNINWRVNIAKAWQMISRITSQQKSINSPVKK